jgi:mitochondrial chaperone BCS1
VSLRTELIAHTSSFLPIDWLLLWLSKQPQWSGSTSSLFLSVYSYHTGGARFLHVKTHPVDDSTSPTVNIGEDDDILAGRKLSYLPSIAQSYTMWYMGHYLSVSRSEEKDTFRESVESLEIRSVYFYTSTCGNLK